MLTPDDWTVFDSLYRLMLAGLVVSSKFHDEVDILSNQGYAAVGGISTYEL